MKRFVTFGMLIASTALAATIARASTTSAPVIVTPSQIHWQTSKLYPSKIKVAVLTGDYATSGWAVIRLEIPDGVKLMPHIHPGPEYVTVMQGTLLVGLGTTMDPAKMKALPAGSYVEVPAKMPHYAQAKGETILQISGPGPLLMQPVSDH